jgi:hypothetical protein
VASPGASILGGEPAPISDPARVVARQGGWLGVPIYPPSDVLKRKDELPAIGIHSL